jgi:hypothetical protein
MKDMCVFFPPFLCTCVGFHRGVATCAPSGEQTDMSITMKRTAWRSECDNLGKERLSRAMRREKALSVCTFAVSDAVLLLTSLLLG